MHYRDSSGNGVLASQVHTTEFLDPLFLAGNGGAADSEMDVDEVYVYINYYSGHPWDTTSWLLYRGGLLIQWNLYIVVTLRTQPVGYYTEVACLYSGSCI